MLRGLYTTGVKRVLPVYSRRCFSNFVAPEGKVKVCHFQDFIISLIYILLDDVYIITLVAFYNYLCLLLSR